QLREEFPQALQISALNKDDVARVHGAIVAAIAAQMQSVSLDIPYGASALMGEIHSKMQVLAEEYHEQGIRLSLKARPADLQRLRKRLQSYR
ncbi:MAG: hypothetical protein ACRC7Q_07290, partial [Plesiomonas shigelloides]